MQGNSIFQSSEKFHVDNQQLSELHTTEDYDLNGRLSLSFVSAFDIYIPLCLSSC